MPEMCPKCGSPKDKFRELSETEMESIYKADKTNDLLMHVIHLSMKIAEACKEGESINLSPTCNETFQKIRKKSWIMKQMAKAEIGTHFDRAEW